VAAVATRPGKVPVKTVKSSTVGGALAGVGDVPPDYGQYVNWQGMGAVPPAIAKQAMLPWPTLPGGQSATALMAGLAKTNWNQQAMNALMPAYSTGVNAINYGLNNAMATAQAKAAAMQGAYTAAGGAMPRVGSEYTALGNVLGGLGAAVAPGAVPQTGAASLVAAGAPGFVAGSVPGDQSAAQSYIFGSAPGADLAQSGYYKDVGAAGQAQAMQMQGREQGMALQQQLQSSAITDYLGKMQDLTANMMGQVPQLGIALSGEARARAAGTLSGLQFETEQRMNVQNLLYQYAQLRAQAGSNAAKFALDRWVGGQLAAYHTSLAQSRATSAQASLTRAQTAQINAAAKAAKTARGGNANLTPDAYARMMQAADEAAQGFYYGKGPNQQGHMVPINQLPSFNASTSKAGQGTQGWDYALSYLQRVFSISKQDAVSVLSQYYQPGQGGRPNPNIISGYTPPTNWQGPLTTNTPSGLFPSFLFPPTK